MRMIRFAGKLIRFAGKSFLNLVALAFLAFVPAAMAEVIKHPATGLQIELPAGWKTRTHAGQLVAEPPDRKSQLTFAVIEEANSAGYVETWAAGMQGRLTDLQVDVDDEVNEVNGLQQIYSVGSATLEGKPIQWDLTIVKGGTRVLAVMALGENLDGDTVQKMYASIQRFAPGGRPVIKGVAALEPSDPNSGAVYPDEVDRGGLGVTCWYNIDGTPDSTHSDPRCPQTKPSGVSGMFQFDPETGKATNFGATEISAPAAPPPLRPAQAPPGRVAEEPVAEKPAAEEPVAEEPAEEEPVAEEPVEEEPVAEEPMDEEPVDEAPVEEEPLAEEPVDEEPVEEELVDEGE